MSLVIGTQTQNLMHVHVHSPEFHLKQNKLCVYLPLWSPNAGRNKKNIYHTSSNGYVLLQGAYIQLQSQLGSRAQESLDHWCSAECRSVGEELALCLAHFFLDFFWEAIFGHLSLLGDADIRLFNVAWLTIDAEDFKTPGNKSSSHDNQRQTGFCLFSATLLRFSRLWLGYSEGYPLL